MEKIRWGEKDGENRWIEIGGDISHRWSYVCGPGTPALIGQTIGQVSHFLSFTPSQDAWLLRCGSGG